MKFNWYIGSALIENESTQLSQADIDFLLTKHKNLEYPEFIYKTFGGIYFTDDENRWLDMVATNINLLKNFYKRALGYFALFQACIAKRPFNLFHRKNLYMRLSQVRRSFGNKSTWDTPFEVHFKRFAAEINRAVFCNNRPNRALNMNVFDIEEKFDLVYVDTPYVSRKGSGVDYLHFYHFLEGLVNYNQWSEMIDYKTKHRRLKRRNSVWTDKKKISGAFDELFRKFRESILVVSYRSDGIPSIEELSALLGRYKSHINKLKWSNYKYVLSNNQSEEVLLIGR